MVVTGTIRQRVGIPGANKTVTLQWGIPDMLCLIFVIRMVADVLAPNRCQDISNHPDDSSVTSVIWILHIVDILLLPLNRLFEKDQEVKNVLVSLVGCYCPVHCELWPSSVNTLVHPSTCLSVCLSFTPFYTPCNKVRGVYWIHPVCLSVRPSVRPSVCLLTFRVLVNVLVIIS